MSGVTRMLCDTSLRGEVLDTKQFSIFQCVPEQEIPSRPILKTLHLAILQLSPPFALIAADDSGKSPISKPKSSMLQSFLLTTLTKLLVSTALSIFNIEE